MSDNQSNNDRLIAVYRAPSENEAHIVRSLLESEGIPATFSPTQIPMYDGIAKLWEGYWGDVMVEDHLADRAREIIQSQESETNNDEGQES